MKLMFSRAPFAEPSRLSGRNVTRLLGQAAGKIKVYWTAYQCARAAQHIYEHLHRMSDADLARRGLTRAEVLKRVRDNLEVKG